MGVYLKNQKQHWALLGFALMGAISSIFALEPLKSWAKFFPFIIGMVSFLIISRESFSKHKALLILNFLIVCCFSMSLLAIIQYVLLLSNGVSGLELRVTSFTTHANSLAKFILPVIPICMTLALVNNNWQKYAYFIITVCLVLAEIFTISRGAWIGMLFGALLLIVLFRSYKIIICLMGLTLLAVILLPPEIGLERFNSIFNLTHQWNIERLNVWLASINMIKDHPIVGLGLNNFQLYYLDYKPLSGQEIFRHAHNTFINIAVEMGLIALGFFIFFLILVFRQVLKVRSCERLVLVSKSIVIGIMSLLVFGLVEYNFNNEGQIVMFFTLLGIAVRLVKEKTMSTPLFDLK